MKRTILLAAALLTLVSCGSARLAMTGDEAALINDSPEVMRVLSIDNKEDLEVLRSISRDFSAADLGTAEYEALAEKLVRTLESCPGGVGLAAPQVGLNRRVVAVERVDKEGSPIEVYPNIHIEEMRGEKQPGGEGCLSVPDQRGDVLRYRDITIRYTDVKNSLPGHPKEVREDISGFAAVIFQHEVDHLEGVLFIDKLTQ